MVMEQREIDATVQPEERPPEPRGDEGAELRRLFSLMLLIRAFEPGPSASTRRRRSAATATWPPARRPPTSAPSAPCATTTC
jgi:hypothetical protein